MILLKLLGKPRGICELVGRENSPVFWKMKGGINDLGARTSWLKVLPIILLAQVLSAVWNADKSWSKSILGDRLMGWKMGQDEARRALLLLTISSLLVHALFSVGLFLDMVLSIFRKISRPMFRKSPSYSLLMQNIST